MTNKLSINNLEEYSIENISALLKCGTIKAKKIRDNISEKLGLEKKLRLTIPKKELFEYIENNPKENFIIRKEKTKDEILSKPFVDRKDIKALLNYDYGKISIIINDIRRLMISDGLTPLLDTVLTKYLKTYLERNKIEY